MTGSVFGYGLSGISRADRFRFGDQPLPRIQYFATGADAGGGPNVVVFDADTHERIFDFFAYDSGFTGGVRVAVGDINGDHIQDIITGAGPGGGSDLRIFDGNTGQLIREFSPYNPLFTGSQFLAWPPQPRRL